MSLFTPDKDPIPACCRNCRNYDWDCDDSSMPTVYSYYSYCTKNIWFPTKKQSCKKQEPYPEPKEEQ